MRRLHEMAAESALSDFAGRARELATLLTLLDDDGPIVVHVHGIAGIGKSTLLGAFATHARARGARIVRIDCRAVEPTPRGFLAELSEALGESLTTVGEAAERLSSMGERVVLVLDTYEVLRLIDTWVRQVFVASCRESTRFAIAGRNPPSAAWRTEPGWRGLFRSLSVEPLDDDDALALLERAGVGAETARRINRIARGHPLALGMAASIATSNPERTATLDEAGLHGTIDELSRAYIDSVSDASTRHALTASSVLRCVTEPLLRAIMPGVPPRDAMDRLATLPFAELRRDGLFIHDAVRSAIATSLATRDPDAYGEYRRAAWAHLRDRIGRASSAELWRVTADLLFLLENPVVREGFFPSGPQPLAVEPATPGDMEAVRAIVLRHGPAKLAAHDAWWRHHLKGFNVVRDADGIVRGFYVMVPSDQLAGEVEAIDPLAAEWRRDLSTKSSAAALFCRRLFDRDVGEGPCATQAACWVDIKRNYIEMRGRLRWVYMTLRDPRPFAVAATQLGFRPTATPTITIGSDVLQSFILDMGPGSVDGWLTELVGADVGSPRAVDASKETHLLDVGARELVLPTGRVGLTSLEFGLLRYLHERPNQAVSRFDLMEAVWGHRNPNSSNVVDVVVRSLRKKLDAEAGALETVRGTGYRLRQPQTS